MNRRWHFIHDFVCGFGVYRPADNADMFCRPAAALLDVQLQCLDDDELDNLYPRYVAAEAQWSKDHPPLPFVISTTLRIPRIKKGFDRMVDLRAVLAANPIMTGPG